LNCDWVVFWHVGEALTPLNTLTLVISAQTIFGRVWVIAGRHYRLLVRVEEDILRHASIATLISIGDTVGTVDDLLLTK